MGLIKPPHKSKARLVFRTLRHEMSLMDYVATNVTIEGVHPFKHSEEPFTERDWPAVLSWTQELWMGVGARDLEAKMPFTPERPSCKDVTLYFARRHFFPKTYEAATVIGDFLKHAGEIN